MIMLFLKTKWHTILLFVYEYNKTKISVSLKLPKPSMESFDNFQKVCNPLQPKSSWLGWRKGTLRWTLRNENLGQVNSCAETLENTPETRIPSQYQSLSADKAWYCGPQETDSPTNNDQQWSITHMRNACRYMHIYIIYISRPFKAVYFQMWFYNSFFFF